MKRHTDVRQSLDAPDPFRVRYRDDLAGFVREAVQGGVRLRRAATVVGDWTTANIPESDRERFAEMAESEPMSLHEGNFARFRLARGRT